MIEITCPLWWGHAGWQSVPEQLASSEEWGRAYSEIVGFEQQLVDHGALVLKFWIGISKDEQLRRFKKREATPHKRWKLTDEDWRNRAAWDDYQVAAHDMVQKTSTNQSPWILIEGDNKLFARVKVIETICDRLEQAILAADRT